MPFGDTLRLVNEDAVPHRLHTSGIPFPHPSNDLAPGQAADFVLAAAYDNSGASAAFWIMVAPESDLTGEIYVFSRIGTNIWVFLQRMRERVS